jgi:hypothetical protein
MADRNYLVERHAEWEPPELAPVIICEKTARGWRGLTRDGEILNVESNSEIARSIRIMRNGEPIGYRAVAEPGEVGVIDAYEQQITAAGLLLRANDAPSALRKIDAAIGLADTAVARLNRSMALLAMGRWSEGFADFASCEQNSELFMRPRYRAAIAAGLQPWRGEKLADKRLLLIHDHGFGDTIMMLRFIPQLIAMGAEVVLQLPAELERLARQLAPVTRDLIDADYFCSTLMLGGLLKLSPEQIATAPYLRVEPQWSQKWRAHLDGKRKHIGIAWLPGALNDGDYPRAIPLGIIAQALGSEGVLISLQQQGGSEADMLGIAHFQFEDFADCAGLMTLMDETWATASPPSNGGAGNNGGLVYLS